MPTTLDGTQLHTCGGLTGGGAGGTSTASPASRKAERSGGGEGGCTGRSGAGWCTAVPNSAGCKEG